MYSLFRPFLFRLDPETAHRLTLQLLRLAGSLPPARWLLQAMYATPEKPVEVFGLKFKNPVGLAAGYDKDGLAIRGLAGLGFGHLEIGTVTPRPQPGNPKPRVFRLVEDQAIINRMGFPGSGKDSVAVSLRGALKGRRSNLRFGVEIASSGTPNPQNSGAGKRGQAKRPTRTCTCRLVPACRRFSRHERCGVSGAGNDTIIGVNLGKNKDTPLEEAANDYVSLVKTFSALADYLAINISSPNTTGLRRLQDRDMLEGLLGAIAMERATSNVQCPILVKLSPDLSNEEFDDALDVILQTGMDGVIATNTTLGREGLRSAHQNETGGLSGGPLRTRSEAVLRQVLKRLDGRIPVVSTGGIMVPEDAKRRLDMGAALVQVYTGLVYAGPGLVQKIIRAV